MRTKQADGAYWAWHMHHARLVERVYEPLTTRRAYIKATKPKHEVPTRLRLLKYVKGRLPLRPWRRENAVKIERLHKKECLNCPWNGWTIFPGK